MESGKKLAADANVNRLNTDKAPITNVETLGFLIFIFR
jgi:hypothetical protein